MNNMHEKSGASSGFTLVEVLMALVILLIGLLGVASMQIMAMKGNLHARESTSRTMAASNLVEWLVSFDDFGHNNLRVRNNNDPDAIKTHAIIIKDDGSYEMEAIHTDDTTDNLDTAPPQNIIPDAVSSVSWIVDPNSWDDDVAGGTSGVYDKGDTINSKRVIAWVYWEGGGRTEVVNLKTNIGLD